MKKSWLVAAILAAVIGIVTSGLLLKIHFNVERYGMEKESFCAISDTNNCDLVAASSYAVVAGLPVAGISLCYYIAVGVMLLVAIFSAALRASTAPFLFWVSVAGIAATLYMGYVSWFILGMICLLCLILYGVNILLFLLLLPAATRSVPPRLVANTLTLLVLMGVGLIFVKSAATATKSPIDTDMAVNVHFRGSLHNIKIDPATDPIWGNPNGRITVVEFSDFQCPHCKLAAFKLKPYLAEFKEDARLVYLHFPLDSACNDGGGMHPMACEAAKGAECMRKAGKFWEYHDALFRNQQTLSPEFIVALAEKLGGDPASFRSCLADPATLAKVKSDIARGRSAQVHGTPAVFINNRSFRFWKDPSILRAVIRRELAAPQK